LARLFDMLTTAWRQRRRFDVAQVDVYSGPAFYWCEAVCWLLRRVKKPYVLTLHGGNLPEFAARYPRRVGRVLHSADYVTVPSRYLHQKMTGFRQDLHVVPNPLDLGAYSFRHRNTVAPQLIWLRSFHTMYNPMLAVRVVAELYRDVPDISLAMVGRDRGDGSLQKTARLANGLGVGNRVDFVGAVAKSEVPEWLDRADVFLNTSDIDNAPVSVLEAMACGLCVVTTNVGGLPCLVDHERTGLLVEANDAKAMAAEVHRLVTTAGLSGGISARAHERVADADWSQVILRWEQILAEAAGSASLDPRSTAAPIA
jgi:glycosyltransferase involved in cell wall biosynthesis